MSFLIDNSDYFHFLEKCAEVAKKSTCHRSKCGSIVVYNNQIIGSGYNSMPCNANQSCFKDTLSPTFKSDKTCCVHAEQRAIMDALKHFPDKVIGSRLYFVRLDDANHIKISGKPYCTICSKMALDAGISEFVLLHTEGITVYNTQEYNVLSFQYQ